MVVGGRAGDVIEMVVGGITGCVIVHGQSVIVSVVAEVTVYVFPLVVIVVGAGQ